MNKLPKFPHQFFYSIALNVRRFLLNVADRLVVPHMAVYEKAQGLWISRAIVAACELNLADHLASGPKNIRELAGLSHTQEDHLYRLLRVLAGEKIFKELPGKIFLNTRLSSALKEGDDSMKHMILHQFGETNMLLFTDFTSCIRTGESNAPKVLGKGAFEYLEENPARNERYNKAMDNSSYLVAMALLSSYDFSGIRTIVDVGGGRGILLKAILDDNQAMKGILFDRQHVVEKAVETAGNAGLQQRFQIISGNFFNEIPQGADAYLLKNILHAFSDDDCHKILSNINSVMAPNGKLIILETIIRPGNDPSFGKLLDLLMMTGTNGGKERTVEEFEDLLSRAGFRISKIKHTIAPFSILEAVKNWES